MSPEQYKRKGSGNDSKSRAANARSDGARPANARSGGARPANTKPDGARPGAGERRRKKLRKRVVIFAVAGTILLAAIAVCVYYFGFVHPKDNYDAQMEIGKERFEAEAYDEAETAFLQALEYEPEDVKATYALTDTYIAWKKYDKAVILLTALQKADETDTRTYEYLITLYVDNMNDISAANGQIIKAYELGIALENKAIAAAPTFTPQGGIYNEATIVTITAGEGQAVYYTTDGSIPTQESTRYEAELTLKNKDPIVVTAAVIAENGLIGWPTVAEYAIDIQYAIDSGSLTYIGKTAAEIMGSAGALFYTGEAGGGYYYRNKSGDCFFVFPWEVFPAVETPTTTSGAAVIAPPDPNKTPLPGTAVCVAVSMKISRLCMQIGDAISVEDLMAGLKIESYSVQASETDGLNHLYYSANGYAFDYTLRDAGTVGGDGEVIVRAG
jgi:tetratricopeptide (TPR) repeat protein